MAVTSPALLVGFGVTGLVLGWTLRPLALMRGYAEPRVSLVAVAVLVFAAAILAYAARATARTVRGGRADLAHHEAVNRLVLGKAAALAGAMVAGGYAGYALAQLGVADPMATTRLWRSGLAALSGLAVMVSALLLERACRVPPRER